MKISAGSRRHPPAPAKGVTLHCISSALLGSQTKDGKQAIKLITEEEGGVLQRRDDPRRRTQSHARRSGFRERGNRVRRGKWAPTR